jgi:hypothetical protein
VVAVRRKDRPEAVSLAGNAAHEWVLKINRCIIPDLVWIIPVHHPIAAYSRAKGMARAIFDCGHMPQNTTFGDMPAATHLRTNAAARARG